MADFSKAFDTCHIPTLIRKLAQRGVGGCALRVIADMYTNAQARLNINGVLGAPFTVTQGVAQGCTLSPLFFDIYIDDLLQAFRESGLGVPIGLLTQSALSFADDLLLLSPDEDATESYLRILRQWCTENKLAINASKSGILRVGALCNKPLRRYTINGAALQYLDENDPAFDEVKHFKYLGFLLPNTGTWQKTFQFRLTKAKQALGQFKAFFYEADVNIQLKIRVANAVVFSHLDYGADIMTLTSSPERQLDGFQGKVYKTILRLPHDTSTDAVRYILGQQSLSSRRTAQRAENLLRIKQLPPETRLREIYDTRTWHGASMSFGEFNMDLANIKARQRYTSIADDELTKALTQTSRARKKVLKQVTREADCAETAHRLRVRHPHLLHFASSPLHPMWRSRPYARTLLAKWLTSKIDHLQHSSHQCKLCGAQVRDARDHFLATCPRTIHQRHTFLHNLEQISLSKIIEYQRCPLQLRPAWILAGGSYLNNQPDMPRNNRVLPRQSPFLPGRSVSPVKGHKDPVTCWRAYQEFREIHSDLPQCVQVYTDGSALSGYAGIGIYLKPRNEQPATLGVPIGKGTNNMAELEAIHYALTWISNHRTELCPQSRPIHIFTDSKYTREVLLSPNNKSINFYLIDDIKAIATRLNRNHNIPISLHWIPSHIEKTMYGTRHIWGNYYADIQAENARKRTRDSDTNRQTHAVRENIYAATLNMLEAITALLKESSRSSPDGPSSQEDDFDAPVDASQGSPQELFDT